MKLDLEHMGLPECKPCPYMKAVEAEGWDVGGLIEPNARDIAYAHNTKRRALAIVVDIKTEPPVSYRIIEGTAKELAEWIEENRPELAEPYDSKDTPHHPWRSLREYADDPEAEERWWQLCDDCDAGRIGLAVDVGDA